MALAESEKDASLRIVGQDVVLGEERVREATREDYKKVPDQRIANEAAVIGKICRALGLPEPPGDE